MLKAREYAFLLLKFRLRSEREICERLKKKGFTEETVKKTLSFLKDKRFINDGLFAKSWIESRLRKPLGLRRIKQELTLKGISKGIIDGQLGIFRDNYPEEEIVARIAKEKFFKLKGVDAEKKKRRISQFLLRRGFSPGIVYEVMNSKGLEG